MTVRRRLALAAWLAGTRALSPLGRIVTAAVRVAEVGESPPPTYPSGPPNVPKRIAAAIPRALIHTKAVCGAVSAGGSAAGRPRGRRSSA